MLQSIRDHTQGWIAGVIISILILSFALWGIHSYFIGGTTSNVVAKVNGVEITKGQLAVAYERLRRESQNSNYGLSDAADATLKDRALQGLINIQVLKHASLKQDYRISSNQINRFLETMPEFQVNGQFSMERFQQVLATTLYTPSDFLDLIRTSLLIDQPRLGMIFSSFSLPFEVNNTIALVNQERHIRYLTVPFQWIAKQSINIPEEKVKTYYEAHEDEFKTPEQVSVEYLELSVKDLMNGVQPTDQALQAFYNENTNAFATPVQWKLDSLLLPVNENATSQEIDNVQNKAMEIYVKAKAGTDFKTLTTEYSLQSANLGQNWLTQNQVPTDLQKGLLTLKEAGQITTPMRSSKGFVILKALDFKEATLMPFDKVKDKVSEAYRHQKAEEMFTDMREKLSTLTYEHPDSLQPAASALGLPIKVSELFTKDKAGKDISSSNKIREIAFSHDVLNLQNNSDVIQKNSDTAIVIRVKSHVMPTLLSLKTVQPQIENKLKNTEIDAKTLQMAEDITQKLRDSQNIDQILQQSQLAWKSIGWIARHSTNVDSAVLEEAFGMPQPDTTDKKIIYSITKIAEGYVVVALDGVQNGKLNNKEEYDVFSEQIQNSQGLLEYGLYKQSIMKQAKIIESI